jgi:hypothetical protein
MIGKNIGQNEEGVRNRGTSYCPEDSTNLWEYWEDWREVSVLLFFVKKNVSIILNFFSRNGLKILGWKLLVTMTITTTMMDLVVALQVS